MWRISRSECLGYPCVDRVVDRCGCHSCLVRRILLVRCHCGESRAVSCSMVVIAVVLKHPVMARMILPCSEESARSCDVVGAVIVSPGLCQIIAA